MGWFSKKEKVPEIPPAPVLPEMPKKTDVKKGLPELPTFSDNLPTKNSNQQPVKSGIADLSGEKGEQPGSGLPKIPSISSLPEPPKKSGEQRRTLELNASIHDKPVTKQAEPIFVRIDKFQSAQKDFNEIKEKVKEIESVLKKIKDVKSKEEEEISAWTNEIEKLKSRLAEVDSNIFSQI